MTERETESWISWPLAVLSNGGIEELNMRFRSWNTTLSISPQTTRSSSSSSSPTHKADTTDKIKMKA